MFASILRRRVSFGASLTHNMYSQAGRDVITFDHVTENVGNCYNKTSGVFTAAYAHAEPNKQLKIMLNHNQNCIGSYYIAPNVSVWQGAVVASGAYLMPNGSVFVHFWDYVHGDKWSVFSPLTMFSGFVAR